MKRLIRGRVNIGQPSYTPLAYVNQLDDITLELDIYNGNSPLDVTGQTVSLYAKRSNTTVVEQLSGLSTASTKVTGDVKNSCFAVPGITEMQLEFTDSTGKTTVSSFYINVNKSLSSEDSITAGNEIAILTEAKKMEPIRQENERGRVEAEKLRVQSETDRAAAETARVEAEELRVTAEAGREKRLSDVEEKATNNATQIADIVKYQANSNKDYECKEHDTLDSRLQADYAMMMDRFNKASLLPYEAEFITASNSYEGKTTGNVIKGRTLQNLYLVRHREALADRLYTTSYATSVSHNFSAGKYTIINSSLKPELKNKVLSFGVFKENNYVRGVGISNGKTSAVVTLEEGEYIHQVVAGFNDGWSEADLNYLNVIILKGDVGTLYDYQPHFEGIKSVNEDGDNLEQVSCGKNLLNWKKEDFETIGPVGKIEKDELGITFDCLGSTTGGYGIKTIKIFHLKPNTQYTFSADWDILRGNPRYSKPYVRVNSITTNTFEGSRDGLFTFTTDNVGMYKLYLYVDNPSPEDVKVRFKDMFFSEGVEKANEPYIEHRLPIKMKNLRSLPNGTCDTSDGVRRIGKVVLNGSENWGGIDVGSINTIRINSTNFLECIAIPNNTNIINDKLPSKYIYASDEEGIFISRVIGTKGNIYIRVLKNKLATQDIAGFKAWLQANPITLYYELETPTKEEGNVEQLRTYDGITNIFTEGSLIEPTISCKVPSNVQAVVMNLREENQTLNNDVNTLQSTTEENNLMNIETNVNQEARLTMLELGVI